ncbi:DNA-binding response regulator, NarL/FixJ family, contains REC and HTH domains [Pseudomonas flavescens]|uniref:DNA-binding response regulator, NarL/FixJ family, contains REC and HTH domains n=1 Tax=Phytopseudomonas flavescens TaxID=29435 RepID=A0A1G8BMX2_9GAMM|nr:response regulator transcription factor [Pseudomonas flavescens]SDH34577.1 DNA-binding response regulator, NarL/FixJ family, contains REC and HTH domains [Pseudomonas flavescens]
MTCRLLLADDHALIRVGVKAMVNELEGYEVVGEAEDGDQAIAMARSLLPDIILLDVSMNRLSGLEALAVIGREVPCARILMLSMHTDAKVVLEALERGAAGYLLKDAAMSELHLALRAVGRGDRYLSAAVARYVIDQALGHVKTIPADSNLTPRQIEMLRLITRGASTRAIADGLGLSVKTVEAHRAQIMRRLRIHDIPGLVLYAVREGLITPDD